MPNRAAAGRIRGNGEAGGRLVTLSSSTGPRLDSGVWHDRFAGAVRWMIAPLLLFASGFFTADFLLSGVYTWPRTSRILVLTITVSVLSYEFVYKEQRARCSGPPGDRPLKALLYSCMVPYALGAMTIMVLARMAF